MSEDMRKRTIGGVRVNRFGELTTQSEDNVTSLATTEMLSETIANAQTEESFAMLETCLSMMRDRGIIGGHDRDVFRIAIWRDDTNITEVVASAIMTKFGDAIGGDTQIMTRIMEKIISETIIEHNGENHDVLYLAEM